MTKIEFHLLADLFPLLDDAEINRLAADIKANGLREKVTLFEGKVLDGRNRYRACRRAGVEPDFYEFDLDQDGDPLAYVVGNLRRRQLCLDSRFAYAVARPE